MGCSTSRNPFAQQLYCAVVHKRCQQIRYTLGPCDAIILFFFSFLFVFWIILVSPFLTLPCSCCLSFQVALSPPPPPPQPTSSPSLHQVGFPLVQCTVHWQEEAVACLVNTCSTQYSKAVRLNPSLEPCFPS